MCSANATAVAAGCSSGTLSRTAGPHQPHHWQDGEEGEEECCFICLADGTPDRPLQRPCPCPRPVHATCLARWQLNKAGTG